jgi:hypothetical protein
LPKRGTRIAHASRRATGSSHETEDGNVSERLDSDILREEFTFEFIKILNGRDLVWLEEDTDQLTSPKGPNRG